MIAKFVKLLTKSTTPKMKTFRNKVQKIPTI